MEQVVIDERIDVGAVFRKDAVKPRWFVWRGCKYEVKEVTYTWEDRVGAARLMLFAVSDGSTMFEISLNRSSLEWRLEKSALP